MVNGQSTTEVSAAFADLLRAGLAINLHKSAQEVQTYVACGELGGARS